MEEEEIQSSKSPVEFLLWAITIGFVLFMAVAYLSEAAFRVKYSVAKVSSVAKTVPTTRDEPVQKEYAKERLMKVRWENKPYVLMAQADYSISGLVVTKNTNFGLRNLSRTTFDGIAFADVGLTWGDMADKKMLKKYFKFKSYKLAWGARRIHWQYKWGTPLAHDYINSHVSHNHLVPANKNIASALLKIKKGDIVKIDGYLVDLYTGNGEVIFKTSMSRDDNDSTARGGGACENIYVTQVQIGRKIYK